MSDQATCYHEAGHAVVGFLLGGCVIHLALGGEADEVLPERMGECRIKWSTLEFEEQVTDHDPRRREILALLAGPVAEQIYDDDPAAMLASIDDVRRAGRLALEITGNSVRGDQLLRRCVAELRKVLSQTRHWAAVAALADELDAHESLEAEEVATVLDFWLAR